MSPDLKRSKIKSPESKIIDKEPNPSYSAEKVPSVLVLDTCKSPEETVTEAMKSSEVDSVINKARKHRKERKESKLIEETIMCIPETLAVEFDDELDDDVVEEEEEEEENTVVEKGSGGKSLKFRPELSNIAEKSTETFQRDSQSSIRDRKSDSFSAEDGSNKAWLQSSSSLVEIGEKNSVGKKTKKDKRSNKDDLLSERSIESGNVCNSFDFRSFLTSPGGESNSLMNNSASVRDKTSGAVGKDKSKHASSKKDRSRASEVEESEEIIVGRSNCSKNIREIDELFETPEKEKEKSDKKSSKLKKSRKDDIYKEDLAGLRRSPRKHKATLSPFKSTGKSPKGLKFGIERTPSIESVGENDLTIAPDESNGGFDDKKDESAVCSISNENSVDFYNVVPVQNGVLNNSKKFQVKAIKRKSFRKSVNTNVDMVDLENTMKSPSILHTATRSTEQSEAALNRDFDVVSISSPSMSSVSSSRTVDSDNESPLLLKTSRRDKVKSSSKSQVSGNSRVKQEQACADSREDSNSLKKSNNMGSKYSFTKPDKKGSSVTFETNEDKNQSGKNKNLHQTTLTQGFFSPKKNKKTADDIDEENLRLAMQLSLDENNTMDKDNDVKIVSPFKKPQPKKDGMTRKKHKDKTDKSKILKEIQNNIDLTLDQHEDLHEDELPPLDTHFHKDPREATVTHKGPNGSLDPAAELSEWCREPEETLPSLEIGW